MADNTPEIRVLIADSAPDAFAEVDEAQVDNSVVRIVARAADATQTMYLLQEHKPDLVVIDGDSAALRPIETLEEIHVKNLPVGGIILWATHDSQKVRAAMRAGAGDFLIKPVSPESLVLSINNVFCLVREKHPGGWELAQPREIRRVSVSAAPGVEGKVVGVCSGKEGVGKTTMATNLAVALAKHRRLKTALLDLDQSDAAVVLNLRPTRSLYGLSQETDELDYDALQACFCQHGSGLRLVPGCLKPGMFDLDVLSVSLLEKGIRALKEKEQFTVVIFPLLRGEQQLQCLSLCDEVICLITSHSLLDLKSAKGFLDRVAGKVVAQEKLRVVLNQYSSDDFVSLEDVEKTLNQKMAMILPMDAKLVADSVNLGVPFVLRNTGNPTSQAVMNLATLIATGKTVAPVTTEKQGSRWGILGRKH